MSHLKVPTLFNVKGKIVLVTGGSSGIGKMVAAGFAQNGAKVYIASRKESALKEAAAEISKDATGSVHYIVGNVSSKAGCDDIVNQFKKRESKLHVLVNNSGISWGGPYDDFPEEKGWDNVFNVNVKSIFYMTVGLTDLLSKDSNSYDPARVINVSSVAAVSPNAETPLAAEGNGTWSYQPSKAAVNHLTTVLAMKLGPKQITVNCVCPGVFPSRMTAFGFKNAGQEAFTSVQPTGRYGSPQDAAGVFLFLASPASAHVTGAHILLDGGARYVGTSIGSTKTSKL
ncbi:NAD(P)-binding protein [Marasmius fiardii PR-910]|nr:NAD(P)-binding protein [Marasmius fiardii PR-910]